MTAAASVEGEIGASGGESGDGAGEGGFRSHGKRIGRSENGVTKGQWCR